MAMLSLFPLNTVLFPGGLLPLHIFEPRYREMIGECLSEDQPFGVVLIKSGQEVGDAAEPYEIGTTARISRSERLPDGRLNIVAFGVERFRIVETERSRSFLRAEVAAYPHDDADLSTEDAAYLRLRGLFERFVRQTLELGDQWTARIGMPSRPGRLGNFVAGRLEIESEQKQALLESATIRSMLDAEAAILESELSALEARLRLARFRKLYDRGRLN